jgi:hypothetical protein
MGGESGSSGDLCGSRGLGLDYWATRARRPIRELQSRGRGLLEQRSEIGRHLPFRALTRNVALAKAGANRSGSDAAAMPALFGRTCYALSAVCEKSKAGSGRERGWIANYSHARIRARYAARLQS